MRQFIQSKKNERPEKQNECPEYRSVISVHGELDGARVLGIHGNTAAQQHLRE
jgi:hypothetical protein